MNETPGDLIAGTDPATIGLLQLCCMYAPAPLPATVLHELPAVLHERELAGDVAPASLPRDSNACELARARLARHGLVTGTDDALTVPTPVRKMLDGRIPPQEREQLRDIARRLLARVHAGQPVVDHLDLYARLAPHAEHLDLHASTDPRQQETVARLAHAAYLNGDLPLTRRLAGQYLASWDTWRSGHADDSGRVLQGARVAQVLGHALTVAGEHAAAAKLNGDTASLLTSAVGPDHPRTLAAVNAVAGDLLLAGDLTGAVDLQTDRWSRAVHAWGPHHISTLCAGNDRALALRLRGQLNRARQSLERALADAKQVLEPDDVLTLVIETNLAATICDQGDAAGARARLEDLHPQIARQLPARNGAARASRLHLAVARLRSGDAESALALLDPAGPGEGLRDAAERLTRSAALRHTGRRDEAHGAAVTAQKEMTRLVGPGHPYTLAADGTLAHALLSLGEPQDAADISARTHAACKTALHPGHLLALGCALILAHSYWALGRRKESRKLARTTAVFAHHSLGTHHPITAAAALAAREASNGSDTGFGSVWDLLI